MCKFFHINEGKFCKCFLAVTCECNATLLQTGSTAERHVIFECGNVASLYWHKVIGNRNTSFIELFYLS